VEQASWTVHKFGGTCLGDAEGYRNAARLLAGDDPTRIGVVVSAMAATTDDLIHALTQAAAGGDGYRKTLRKILERTENTARELLTDPFPVLDSIHPDSRDIEDVLRGVQIARSFPDRTEDLVLGYGEIWSAQLLHAHLAEAGHSVQWLNARDVLFVEHGVTGPVVDWESTADRLSARLNGERCKILVITGFIASDKDGLATTLKRNGSDFSASIFAKLLSATSITIWTDVDGIMSADPRRVPEAVVLPELSYNEAMELAYFGATVLHPHTMGPAIAGLIPVHVRNAFRPEEPGTVLRATSDGQDPLAQPAVKGFSSTEPIALLNVEGAGMIGVPGVASRLFTALREVDVSVIMISQASSEHSICLAVPMTQAARAKTAVQGAFALELQHGQIQTVDLSGPYRILAAVGDRMADTPGVSSRFFGALGKAGVNVRAIAQGSSERNISVVVAERDAARALRAVHAGFYLSDQTLSVGLIGPGAIGSELLAQLREQAALLHSRFQIDLRVRGILSTKAMVLSERGLDLTTWAEELSERGEAPDLEAFTAHVHADHFPHAVIVDCTASDQVTHHYESWLSQGIHVITPNKKANSGALELYRRLQEISHKNGTHYLYEATVGAGLPVITTLRDLIQTGDQVLRMEGILSGTLSYLFNNFDGDRSFADLIRSAMEMGYTEPDPREDLSGMDMARKAVILAREMGASVELSELNVQDLVPEPLRDLETGEFLERLDQHDAHFEALRTNAQDQCPCQCKCLRYVASIEGGAISLGLRRYAPDHPFSRLVGTDNILAFTTKRYHRQPLIVQGPGAGPEVTAGAVFADLLRLASYLGAPS
jgi:aspartokinase/homoserine dehydrogenase 1